MVFDVHVRINETTSGIGTDVNIRLEVNQAESGLYIASCLESPLVAAGKTPRYAILEYLGNLFCSRTVEAKKAR